MFYHVSVWQGDKGASLVFHHNRWLFFEDHSCDRLEVSYSDVMLKNVALLGQTELNAQVSFVRLAPPTKLLCVYSPHTPFSPSCSFVSMNHLPVELLAEIFGYVAKGNAINLRHALFVCRPWYRFLISNKTLWSTINLNGAFCAYFIHRPQHLEVDFVTTCLGWSGDVPLTLALDFREIYYRIYGGRNKNRFAREGLPTRLLNLLLVVGAQERRVSRYRHLRVTYCPLLIAPAIINMALAPYLKALESITITNCIIMQLDLLIRSMPSPRLREISIFDYDRPIPPTLFDGINLTTVTHLTMHRMESWDEADPLLLQSFSSIRHLTLSCGLKLVEDGWTKVGTYEGSHPAPLSIPFPRLHTLRLVGLIPSAILRALKLASISDLYLLVDVRHQHSLTRVLGLAWINIIKDMWIEEVSPEDRSWEEDLRILMAETEQLERLTVPVWMSNFDPQKDVQIMPMSLGFPSRIEHDMGVATY